MIAYDAGLTRRRKVRLLRVPVKPLERTRLAYLFPSEQVDAVYLPEAYAPVLGGNFEPVEALKRPDERRAIFPGTHIPVPPEALGLRQFSCILGEGTPVEMYLSAKGCGARGYSSERRAFAAALESPESDVDELISARPFFGYMKEAGGSPRGDARKAANDTRTCLRGNGRGWRMKSTLNLAANPVPREVSELAAEIAVEPKKREATYGLAEMAEHCLRWGLDQEISMVPSDRRCNEFSGKLGNDEFIAALEDYFTLFMTAAGSLRFEPPQENERFSLAQKGKRYSAILIGDISIAIPEAPRGQVCTNWYLNKDLVNAGKAGNFHVDAESQNAILVDEKDLAKVYATIFGVYFTDAEAFLRHNNEYARKQQCRVLGAAGIEVTQRKDILRFAFEYDSPEGKKTLATIPINVSAPNYFKILD